MPFASTPAGTVHVPTVFSVTPDTDPEVTSVLPVEFHTSKSTRRFPPSASIAPPCNVGVVLFVNTIAGLPPHCAEHGLVNRPATVPGYEL